MQIFKDEKIAFQNLYISLLA